jgi:hypothetical protein
MTPTPKLRFVERVVPAPEHGEGIGKTVRILQQWWVSDLTGHWVTATEFRPDGEWRDVPVEKEDK